MFAVTLGVGLFPASGLTAEATPPPISGDPSVERSAVQREASRKSVLILSGTQYGLPVSDSMIAGAVAALKQKGISANDIYVENLDVVRNNDPRWRAALASLLREKLAKANLSLVIVANQAALQFLAQEGYDLVPANTPVLTALSRKSTVAWRGAPLPLLNISNRGDVPGTLRYGLELFPRTRRLLIVDGANDQQYALDAKVAEALTALGANLEVERTHMLAHEEMLQRVSSLPPDTLVLVGSYFKDLTGRSFIPAEVAGEVGRRANRPVLVLYDAHLSDGVTGGSVLLLTSMGRRAGEIGFEFLSGARSFDGSDIEATVSPKRRCGNIKSNSRRWSRIARPGWPKPRSGPRPPTSPKASSSPT